ncbi:hypothetical protein UMZ34_16855 [Halopseudomonas pachastrellae]|nr:hypothetical protein UMZ34_16855 [Halopseudomonas pachastrellae]
MNSGTLVCTAPRDLVILRNTAATFLSTALNPAQFQKVRILIDDDFSISTFSGVLHLGKGTVFEAVWDGAAWVDLGEMNPLGDGERVRGFTTAMVLNWDNTPIKRSRLRCHLVLQALPLECLTARLAPSFLRGSRALALEEKLLRVGFNVQVD